MNRTVTIVTPENIQVTYQVAGFASRFAATLIDVTAQLALVLIVLQIIGIADSSVIGGLVSSVGLVSIFLVLFAYPIFFELLWGGRTPGKRLLGLRVIRDGGFPINMGSSAIRNVLRFVDFGIIPLTPPLILCGLPGLISIFLSPTYKRIGDYAAGTLVIVEAGATPFTTRTTAITSVQNVTAFLPLIRNLDRITPAEYRVIRRFTARRPALDLIVQAAIGERLALLLMTKLELPVQILYQIQFADVLSAIEQRYAEEHGIL